jgi:hypothetical protein
VTIRTLDLIAESTVLLIDAVEEADDVERLYPDRQEALGVRGRGIIVGGIEQGVEAIEQGSDQPVHLWVVGLKRRRMSERMLALERPEVRDVLQTLLAMSRWLLRGGEQRISSHHVVGRSDAAARISRWSISTSSIHPKHTGSRSFIQPAAVASPSFPRGRNAQIRNRDRRPTRRARTALVPAGMLKRRRAR